jgi:phage-related protein
VLLELLHSAAETAGQVIMKLLHSAAETAGQVVMKLLHSAAETAGQVVMKLLHSAAETAGQVVMKLLHSAAETAVVMRMFADSVAVCCVCCALRQLLPTRTMETCGESFCPVYRAEQHA